MTLARNTRLGPYLIQAQIGAGGMGEVYRAVDSRLDRTVAIKVLPPHASGDPQALQRFEREARAISRFNHPNVCTLYDVGHDGSVPFLVMEYLDGRPLTELIARGPLAVPDAVRYGRQIAEALACAHGTGIVHRDLKPANVIITRDDVAKVLDFGLAKSQLTELDETRAALTQEGLSLGTVQYMSPEHIHGSAVDSRSDVFSFGIVLYEMLCGARPFAASNIFAIADRIQAQEPTPIDERRPDVPLALRNVVNRALRKHPDERFQHGGDLASALRDIERQLASGVALPVAADPNHDRVSPPRTPSRVSARLIRRPAIVVLILTMAIVAAAAWHTQAWSRVAGLWRPSANALTTPAPPSSPVELTRQGHALLHRHDVPENVDRALDSFKQALARDESNAFAHAGLAQAYYWKDATTPDPQLIRQASAAAGRAIALNPDIAAAHLASGIVLFKQGEHDKAQSALETARTLDPQNGRVRVWLGELQRLRRRTDEADAHFREAAGLTPDDWMVHLYWGRLHYGAARYADAVAAWEKARTLAPDNVLVLRNLAAAYHMVNRTDDAAAALQRALEVKPSASIYNNLGTLRFFQGQYLQSVAAFERAVEMNPTFALYWGNLGDAHRWAPGPDHERKAAEAYARATQLAGDALAKSPDNVETRASRAIYLVKSGHTREALEEIGRVERTTGRPAASYFKSMVVYELAGQRDQALRDLEKSLAEGYSVREIANEPELTRLRADARYHRIVVKYQQP